MNVARELAWWAELGQINLDNYREKAQRRLREDFETKMAVYQSKGPLNFDVLIRPFDFDECKKEAEDIMVRIKEVVSNPDVPVDPLLEKKIEQTFTVVYSHGIFHSNPSSGRIPQSAVVILFYTFLNRVKVSDFKQCKYSKCDDLFFPYTTKPKAYCSKRCSTLAGQDGEN